MNRIFGILLVLIIFSAFGAKAQSLEKFGQNNIQYDYLKWDNLDTSHFRIFFYGKGKNVAALAGNIAEDVTTNLAEKLKIYIDYKANLVIYTNFNHYIQSNAHQLNEDLILDNAGKIRLVGKTYLVYYDGKIDNLRDQIKEQVIRGVIEDIVYKGTKKNLARTSFQIDIPHWFTEGLVKFMSDSISSLDVRKMESYMLEHPKLKLYTMAYDDPVLAGKLFWDMIYDKIGNKDALRILGKSVSSKSYSRTLKRILKEENFKNINNAWVEHCKDLVEKNNLLSIRDDSSDAQLSMPVQNLNLYSEFYASPLRPEFLYTKRTLNSWKLRDFNEFGKNDPLLIGPKIAFGKEQDPLSPLLMWSHNGQGLGILFTENGRYKFKYYNALSREFFTRNVKPKSFERVLSASFTESSNNILMSVVKRGQSDIVMYTISTKQVKNITNDDYVDIEPIYFYSQYRKGLLWLSNRDTTTIVLSRNTTGEFQELNYNIYYKDAQKNIGTDVEQLTHYRKSRISNLSQFDENSISFFLDSNNVRYRMILEFQKRDMNTDTFRIYEVPTTEYPIAQQYIIHQKKMALFTYDRGKVNMRIMEPDVALLDTLFNPMLQRERAIQDSINMSKLEIKETIDEKQYGNFFMSKFYDESEIGKIQEYLEIDSITYLQKKKRVQITSSVPNFKKINSSLKLNNDILITRYQNIATTGLGFLNPTLSEMVQLEVDDILNDYSIWGGLKFNIAEAGSEEFIKFTNRKRRVNWGVTGYRKSSNRYDEGKTVIYYLEPEVTYALGDLSRFTLNVGYRLDRYLPYPIDLASLEDAPTFSQWFSSRLEYVYDDSYIPEDNIHKGQRLKLFGEFFQNFRDKQTVTNLGLDLRGYLPLHRHIIWANRLAAAASFGNSRILYFIGGVENEILTTDFSKNFSNSGTSYLNNPYTTVDPSLNFVMQTRANPLRGYQQNSRNGNGYIIINSEIRIPFFSTFARRPINSTFLRSLQLLIFGDIGMAWNGNFPTQENTQSYYYVPGNPPGQANLYIRNPYFNAPVGFGPGIRGELWNYYFKLDAAWNTQRLEAVPRFHLSLGFDF